MLYRQRPTMGQRPATHRRLAQLLTLTLMLLGLALTLPAGALAAGWKAQNSGTTTAFFPGVAFANDSDGWVTGFDSANVGIILHTTNGGTAWTTQSSGTTPEVYRVACANASDAWAVGPGGTIVATSNGGATWSAQRSGTTDKLDAVAFANSRDGWAVGQSGTILATTDGGATWTGQLSEASGDLWAVAAVNASDAWAVSDGGDIIATTDGGDWNLTTPLDSSNSPYQLWGVAFANTSDGWAVGDDTNGSSGQQGVVLATTNGGATWSPQSSPATDELNAVAFANASDGWAVSNSGEIIATTNGGKTWSAQTSPTTTDLWGLAVPDATHGWAVGDTNTILAYTSSVTHLTLKLSGLSSGALKLGKRLKVTGTVPPTSFAGCKVWLTVDCKQDGKWHLLKTHSRLTPTADDTYSWSYRPAKRGTYRICAVYSSTTHLVAETKWKTFKVK